MIDLTALPKDCDCITHDGLHWLHMDRVTFELNLKILVGRGQLRLYAYAQAEAIRLRNKRHEMQHYTNDENEVFIWPEGYRERDYEAQRKELLNRLIAEDEVQS